MGNLMHAKQSEINIKSFVIMILSGCLVGLGPIIAKSILAPAIVIVLYRISLPIPVLYFMSKMQTRGMVAKEPKLWRDKLLMASIGLFFALDLATFYTSLRYTSVAAATLLSNLSPIFITTFSIIRKQRITIEIIWLLMCVIGLVFLCGNKGAYKSNEIFGYMSALAASGFFSGYILLINKLGKKYSSTNIMLWSSTGGAICVLVICFFLNIDIHITSLRSIYYILLLSLGIQMIGQSLLTKAISIFPPAFSSLGVLIDPVAASFFAWIILKEPLSLPEMLGMVFILIGIFGSYQFQKNEGNEICDKEIVYADH